MHRQTSEGVLTDVIKYTTSTNKLQGRFTHLEWLYTNEKVATKAKQIKIGYIEKQFYELAKYPSDKILVQSFLKKRRKSLLWKRNWIC